MSYAPLTKFFRKHARPDPFRLLAIGLCAGALFGMTGVGAADRATIAAAEKEYKEARTACLAGQSHQDRPTCLQEAGAALQEARRGVLATAGSADYEKNRLLRCEHQPQADRDLCERRMNGEGTVSGSVKGGGIYRELVVTVPAPD